MKMNKFLYCQVIMTRKSANHNAFLKLKKLVLKALINSLTRTFLML